MPFHLSTKPRCPVSICFTKAGETRLLRCGKWSCPHCARLLSKRWARRVFKALEWEKFLLYGDSQAINPPYWFMTFTLKGKRLTIKRAYERLPVLWERLRKRFQREYKDWTYIAFVEGQPNRQYMPHFHLISNHVPPRTRNTRGIVTKHNMHNFAHSVGFGFQADIQEVTTARAAFYVTKYMSKQGKGAPKNFRRARASRGLLKLDPNPERKYIVKRRNEGVGDFVTRVSEETRLSEVEVYTRMALAWAENADELGTFPRKW